MSPLETLLPRIEHLLDRLEGAPAPVINWKKTHAARWIAETRSLRPIARPHRIESRHLLNIDEQKRKIDANTRQFVAGKPANNVLLTGARGTGKSSLVKAMLAKYAAKGLRLVELDKAGLAHLPELFDLLPQGPQRFILFCDDLSFTSDEPGYPALKAALDGSLSTPADNVLIYATSNRRHLMPEYMAENESAHPALWDEFRRSQNGEAKHVGGEVHPGEAIEEKISLSERFGLWISFYPMDQDEYLSIAAHWARELGARDCQSEAFTRAALQWSLGRGARSGRTAWQFARDWAGQGK
ncbi:MAG: ATP-binding protein [Pseudomonadota bacterium]